jgi:Ca-activated chloride channel family protein
MVRCRRATRWRVEEMVNYFDYSYRMPKNRNAPFEPTIAVYPSPWNKDNANFCTSASRGSTFPRTNGPRPISFS